MTLLLLSLLSLLFVAFVSLMLTQAMRKFALSRSILDLPNERSSHSIPTPRGGGVAIALSFLCVLPVFGLLHLSDWVFITALVGAGSISAVLGFLDDRRHIPVRWRLLGHFLGATWALLVLNGLPPINVFGLKVDLGWLGHIIALLCLVWMLNLYNFMDGIDGIASVEAISVCIGACIIYWTMGFDELVWAPLSLSMSVLGFLYWNFPPARIFMGDAGSGFLGITFGVFSLQAAWYDPDMLWVWFILLGVFVVDSTFTLVRRFIKGDRLHEAHCNHTYQIASRRCGGHLFVTTAVLAINMCWLLPIALCVVLLGLDGLVGIILSYVPLVLLAVYFKAGKG